MRNPVSRVRAVLLARVAMVALLSGGAAACSSDSTRFGESPFSNPFTTGSVTPKRAQQHRAEPAYTGGIRPAPSSRVERAPLGALPPAQAAPMRGYGDGSYRSSSAEPATTGSLPPASRPYAGRTATSSNWTADGGTAVTLGSGDSIASLSQRYGVPASAIMQANNLTSANSVGEGTRIVIPVYSVAGNRVASASPVAASAERPAPAPMASSRYVAPTHPQGGSHTVASGETLSSVARQYGTTRTALANANGISADTMVRSGQRLTIPGQSGGQMASMQRPSGPSATGTVGQPRMQLVPGPQARGESQKQAAAQPSLKPSVAASQAQAFAGSPTKPSEAPEPSESVKQASVKVDPAPAAAPSGPSFRWPVRGRVISGYGSKTNGSTNDGINLAVPEGTEVKASDDGVVAYSGSELKGFGNLVLIRHSNGWVTAYAHNSALEVKRGDTVRRGQVIAKSGSTGNVTSPQLHFEVRKGASAVDPMDHLAGV